MSAVSAFRSFCQENTFLAKEKDWQAEQLNSFLQRGFPTRSEERWKYTDMRFLAERNFTLAKPVPLPFLEIEKKWESIRLVFVNGYFSLEHSNLTSLPSGVIFAPLSQRDATDAYLLKEYDVKQHPFAVLNTSLMTDGFYLWIPDHIKIDLFIHCVHVTTEASSIMMHPRNILLAGASSRLTLVEEYCGTQSEHYFRNALTTLHLKEGASLTHFLIQKEAATAYHMHSLFVLQEKDSLLKSFNLAKGSALARTNIQVDLTGKAAACHFHGLYATEHHQQQIDHYLQVNHLAPFGESSMMFKGLLNKKSRATFNGKVYVEAGAKQIRAQQFNHNLLLSSDAEVNTKPELEIYTDDIQCSHGATVGQLDADALFYLQARGIDKMTALDLLTRAFLIDVFHKIDDPLLRQYLMIQAGVFDE